MVSLHTVRRVLAVDLGLGPAAIERCLADAVVPVPGPAGGATEIPLADALRIVAIAEAQAVPVAS